MSKSNNNIAVGSKVTIPAGTKVKVGGETIVRKMASTVTVRRVEFTPAGNARVTWKSHGLMTSAIVKTAK